jgi:hypothetical protein
VRVLINRINYHFLHVHRNIQVQLWGVNRLLIKIEIRGSIDIFRLPIPFSFGRLIILINKAMSRNPFTGAKRRVWANLVILIERWTMTNLPKPEKIKRPPRGEVIVPRSRVLILWQPT